MRQPRYRVRNFKFTAEKGRWTVHPIRQGDNLYLLAEKYGTSVLQIIQDNPTLDPRYLKVGQKVLVRK
ncbi:MAG TPA: LysM peptidoglycan-binding domain-containing protein [Firmicutes bacterium]|jgi:LysM repeat protein|nr:LysM peptidoglycan-binding domain-containing protein [Bacillota bacterium]